MTNIENLSTSLLYQVNTSKIGGGQTESGSGFAVADQADEAEKNASPLINTAHILFSDELQKTLVGLQEVESASIDSESDSKTASAADKFLEYMELSPEERMRQDILEQMELTEEDLAKMSPDERKAVEEEIAQRIKDKSEGIAIAA